MNIEISAVKLPDEELQILVEDKYLSYEQQVAIYQNLLEKMGYRIEITEERHSSYPGYIQVNYRVVSKEDPNIAWGGGYEILPKGET